MKSPERKKSFYYQLTLFFFVLFILVLPLSTAWCFSDDECIDCHSQSSEQTSKTIDVERFLSSVHGEEISCAECHQDVIDETHAEKPGTGVVDCGTCHEGKGQHGNNASIACYACHTRHNMYPMSDTRSALNRQNMKNTCGQCHSKQVDRPKGFLYFTSFQIASHPKESLFNQYSKNMCISCHQGAAAHGEATQIDNNNCFKCHMEVGNYAGVLGYFHGPPAEDFTHKILIIGFHITAILILLSIFFFNIFKISLRRLHDFKKKNDTWPILPPL